MRRTVLLLLCTFVWMSWPAAASAQVQAVFGALISPEAGNPWNKEVGIELNGGIRIGERHIIEADVTIMPLSDRNQSDLAVAVASLTDPNMVEMLDPGLSVLARYRGTPFSGLIPGTDVGLALDLFGGAGLLVSEVELGTIDYNSASCVVSERYQNFTPAFTVGTAFKVLVHPTVALRLDLHVLISPDEVLDFKNPQSAQENRNLPVNANRLDCGSSDARCVLGAEVLHFLGFGVDFYLPEVGS